MSEEELAGTIMHVAKAAAALVRYAEGEIPLPIGDPPITGQYLKTLDEVASLLLAALTHPQAAHLFLTYSYGAPFNQVDLSGRVEFITPIPLDRPTGTSVVLALGQHDPARPARATLHLHLSISSRDRSGNVVDDAKGVLEKWLERELPVDQRLAHPNKKRPGRL